jgi:hypothetical protein
LMGAPAKKRKERLQKHYDALVQQEPHAATPASPPSDERNPPLSDERLPRQQLNFGTPNAARPSTASPGSSYDRDDETPGQGRNEAFTIRDLAGFLIRGLQTPSQSRAGATSPPSSSRTPCPSPYRRVSPSRTYSWPSSARVRGTAPAMN